jgi:4-amino-4-deoxy-L-arabinose transferase-like glycosyltransferase
MAGPCPSSTSARSAGVRVSTGPSACGPARAAGGGWWRVALGFAVLYGALRLPGLATWAPLLNDEALESHRALLIHADLANLWISNVEYKPPLFYWLASLLVGHVPDPRLAVRLISAASGLGSLLVVLHVARRLADTSTALLAGVLFLLLPHNLIYHRVGYMEPLVAFFGLSAFALVLDAGTAPERRLILQGMLAGLLLGLAFFTKQSALLAFPLPLLWVALVAPRRAAAWRALGPLYLLATGGIVWFVTAPNIESMWAGGVVASPLTFLYSYTMPLSKLVGLPWDQWRNNAEVLSTFAAESFGLAISVFAGVGLLFAFLTRDRLALFAALAGGVPAAVFLLTSTGLHGKTYMLTPLAAPVCLLAARAVTGGIKQVHFRRAFSTAAALAAFSALLLIEPILFASRLAADPLDVLRHLREPVLASNSLSEEQIPAMARWLAGRGAASPVTVLSSENFGMPNDGLAVLLWNEPRVQRRYIWWIPNKSIPLLPDFPAQVHTSNHHRTTPPILLPPSEWRERPIYWVVNSIQYPPKFVQKRAGGHATLAVRFPSRDGSSLDAWLLTP